VTAAATAAHVQTPRCLSHLIVPNEAPSAYPANTVICCVSNRVDHRHHATIEEGPRFLHGVGGMMHIIQLRVNNSPPRAFMFTMLNRTLCGQQHSYSICTLPLATACSKRALLATFGIPLRAHTPPQRTIRLQKPGSSAPARTPRGHSGTAYRAKTAQVRTFQTTFLSFVEHLRIIPTEQGQLSLCAALP
jgi:hypothetical protein